MKSLDTYKGCLLGGAIGDAFGYQIEFFDLEHIHKIYGKEGLIELVLTNGKARISDDTQMTLFSANGLLMWAANDNKGSFLLPEAFVYSAYKEWIETQLERKPILEHQKTWLYNEPELHHSRSPGRTCMFTIANSEKGASIDTPLNNSKGCGGIMRVAPVCLINGGKSIEDTIDLAARTAALTHGHPLGYIPAGMLCAMLFLILFSDKSVKEASMEALKQTEKQFGKKREWAYFEDLINKAIKLAESDISDYKAIHMLGEGWVAEETLAIAVYSSVKYQSEFKKAIICSTNHDGDSDSTGAVTGNILGAYLGLEAISKDFCPEQIEAEDIIMEIAKDLYYAASLDTHKAYADDKWVKKYIDATYKMSDG